VRTRNAPGGCPRPEGLAADDHVVLSVSDTGSGMSEEVRASAFEPFFTTKDPGRGTGLGLSMVYGVAGQAGGTAVIESTPGKGTTVSLWLPRTEEPAAPERKPEAEAPEFARVLRVLLVDDDPAVRASASEMLRELGHAVTEADNGVEALTLLRTEQEYDLMLVDFAMPEMNGSDLAAAARVSRPELRVVFMTGYVSGDGMRAWSAQGYPTVEKPFNLAELASALGLAVAAKWDPLREHEAG
jgi:CheY-like chemotaxis protein